MERWNSVGPRVPATSPRARDITEAQAETILNKVLEAGINYIDTSIGYGLSEERIGRYISHRRAEYYLASKCGCLVGVRDVGSSGRALRLLPHISRNTGTYPTQHRPDRQRQSRVWAAQRPSDLLGMQPRQRIFAA